MDETTKAPGSDWGLGHFRDSPALLAAAIRYLESAAPTGQLSLFAV